MSQEFIESLSNEPDRQEASERLYQLGKRISGEWALDNRDRRINSNHVAIWGSALRTAANTNTQLSFLTKVEEDVDGLLGGHIKASEINSSERYYPAVDYDNF